MVTYRFADDEDNTDNLNGVDVAAMITAVAKDGSDRVSLTVFPPDEEPAPLEPGEPIPFSETPQAGHWSWPARV
jgi:hypothetical protein